MVEATRRWWAGGGPLRAFAARFVLLALLWVVLTENDPEARLIGLVLAAAAALYSLRLGPELPQNIRLAGLIGYLPAFLWQSLRGGVDVAARAFNPRLPLAPAIIEHRLRLPEGPGRVTFCDVLSLLPGTLAVGLRGDQLSIHVLDAGPSVREEIVATERHLGRLFGLLGNG